MQTENLEGQESIFDRDSACGKMSSVLSQVGGTLKRVKKSLGRIFKKSSKWKCQEMCSREIPKI